MTVDNGGFEQGSGGIATDWTVTTSVASWAFADFTESPHDVGFEAFLLGWAGVEYVGSYSGWYVDLTPMVFSPGPSQEPLDSFEKDWGSTALITTLSSSPAAFDTTPEYFEDYEEDWGSYWWTLPSVTYAAFDTTPENFEDYEDDWGLVSPQTLITAYTGIGTDLTAATFDNTGGGGGAADTYEPFDDTAFPSLTL